MREAVKMRPSVKCMNRVEEEQVVGGLGVLRGSARTRKIENAYVMATTSWGCCEYAFVHFMTDL